MVLPYLSPLKSYADPAYRCYLSGRADQATTTISLRPYYLPIHLPEVSYSPVGWLLPQMGIDQLLPFKTLFPGWKP